MVHEAEVDSGIKEIHDLYERSYASKKDEEVVRVVDERLVRLEADIKLLWEAIRVHTAILTRYSERLKYVEDQVEKLRFRP